jgi:CheY-like chemotaxis protein
MHDYAELLNAKIIRIQVGRFFESGLICFTLALKMPVLRMMINPKNFLLADDDPDDQEMLEEAILEADPAIKLHMARNGQQALEYLQSCTDSELPCFIILDYKMPVFNAVEVLDRIHVQPRLSAIPKVVWSTSNQPEHVKLCLQKGALEYFVKPSQIGELKSIVDRMLYLCEKTLEKRHQ